MLRTLAVLVALLSLTASIGAQTAPTSLDTVLAQSHTRSKLLHSVGVSGAPLSTSPRPILLQDLHRRQSLRQYLHFAG
jgi:hypothetical protein